VTGYEDAQDGGAVAGGWRLRRRTDLILGVAVTALLGAGGFVTYAVVNANQAVDACLVGTWTLAALPFELADSGVLANGGGLSVVYRTDGSGSQTLTNLQVGADEKVNGTITFRYAASHRLIRYTEVAGHIVIDVPDSHMNHPQSNLADDAYTCRGDTLTINPDAQPPEVLRRS
jgi:hypothetical protein